VENCDQKFHLDLDQLLLFLRLKELNLLLVIYQHPIFVS
jgi:hypothetical protein